MTAFFDAAKMSNESLLKACREFRMAVNHLIASGGEYPEPIKALQRERENLETEAKRRLLCLPEGLDYYPDWSKENASS